MSALSTEFRPLPLPPGKTFHDLNGDQRLRVVYGQLDRLRQANGAYVSAPMTAEQAGGDVGYDVLSLRDVLLASTANEYLGEAERLLGTYALALQLLEKFHHRIIDAIAAWPPPADYTSHLLPDRYHPRSLAEIVDGGSGHHIYSVGLLMYKLGDLMKHGFNLIVRPAEIHLLKDLTQYVHNSRWAQEPDQGFWHEDLTQHASSLAAVIGGFTMWQAGGYYDFRYPVNRDISRLIPVPDRLVVEGREALMALLPRETADRDRDLAQLSLIWPFNVLHADPDLQDAILAQVEGLVGDHGVRRFDGDDQEWPLGLAWLAVTLSKLVYRDQERGLPRAKLDELVDRAVAYVERLDRTVQPDGSIPEHYVDGKPGPCAPFAPAHGMYITAALSIRQARAEIKLKS
jgi:phosphorylase kinase alpha/beta subunit